MKNLKSLPLKKMGKQDRERQVLIGLVDYHIKTGKPVGSHTLQEAGFKELSSATIRNYFANLEAAGYLSQPHASGGRLPTDLAFRTYADTFIEGPLLKLKENPFEEIRKSQSREIAAFLQQSAEQLSSSTQCAVFLSAPRFDQDFVIDIRFVIIDAQRCLCILITDFGVVQTEILQTPYKLTAFAAKRIESYFHWRITGHNKPENMDQEEEKLAQSLYHEVMVRYIVGYSNFIDEDLYRTGASRLLTYPEFQEGALLASSLSLFENSQGMRTLLRASTSSEQLKCWIGSDLTPYATNTPSCSVITTPYRINRAAVGAVGILGPIRMPYPKLFTLLNLFSEAVSEALTHNLYKFKLKYRQPEKNSLYLQKEGQQFVGQSTPILLEDKRQSSNQGEI